MSALRGAQAVWARPGCTQLVRRPRRDSIEYTHDVKAPTYARISEETYGETSFNIMEYNLQRALPLRIKFVDRLLTLAYVHAQGLVPTFLLFLLQCLLAFL